MLELQLRQYLCTEHARFCLVTYSPQQPDYKSSDIIKIYSIFWHLSRNKGPTCEGAKEPQRQKALFKNQTEEEAEICQTRPTEKC